MHGLTHVTLAERIGLRFARSVRLPEFTQASEYACARPVIADGFGYNHALLEDPIDTWDLETVIPLILLLAEGLTFDKDRSELAVLVDAYAAGEDASAFLDRLAPLCDQIYGWYPREWLDLYDGDPAYIPQHLLTDLAAQDPANVLELCDRLDGLAFRVLEHVDRLSYLEVNYATLDPYVDCPPDFELEAYDTYVRDKETFLSSHAVWGKPGEVFRSRVNPYKGGGFSCTS